MMATEAIAEIRICSKCGVEKPLVLFAKNPQSRGGRERRCKQCAADNAKRYRDANPERAKAAIADWYARGGKENKRAWSANNRDRIKASRLKWAAKNSAKNVERVNAWRKKNPEKRRAQARADAARKRATPRGRLDQVMASAISGALRGAKAGRAWTNLVGYTVDELMLHLERQFLPGMTWENYGKWHVDHVIPKAVFNYTAPEHIDFSRCWALQNLQPLWALDNLVKGHKLDRPFQPSLAL